MYVTYRLNTKLRTICKLKNKFIINHFEFENKWIYLF